MECHEGTAMIKSYRGLIADGAIDTILLHSNDGSMGYRIVKLAVMPYNLNSSTEAAIKIYKTPQDTATFDFDFSDNTLLAAAYYTVNASADSYPEDHHVIFDQEIFNQDLYITHKNNDNVPMNYYLELEQVSLSLNENTVATLKDMRNTVLPRPVVS